MDFGEQNFLGGFKLAIFPLEYSDLTELCSMSISMYFQTLKNNMGFTLSFFLNTASAV